MKWIRRILALVIILVVLVVVVLLITVDTVARTAIEKGSSYALGVPTSLDGVSIGIFSGNFSLSELEVSNPEGFKTDHFLQLNNGAIAVSMRTLLQDRIVVPQLALTGLDVNLERSSAGSNYKIILNNLNRFQSSEPTSEERTDQKQFVINEIVIRDVAVHADVIPVGGSMSRTTVKIPEIRLTDVGSETGSGAMLSELSSTIVTAVLQAVAQKGMDLPGDMLKELQGGLDTLPLKDVGVKVIGDVQSVAGEMGQKVGEVGQQAVEEGAGKIKEGLGGLFKNKSEQQATE